MMTTEDQFETRERVAVLEVEMSTIKNDVKLVIEKVDGLRQMLAEGRGAGRLAKTLAVFFGFGTAGAIMTKWGAILAWIGSK